MDPRAINTLFPRLSTVLPKIPDAIQRIAAARFVTVVDLLAGFHQVRLPDDLVPYLAFTLPDGRRFEWLVWPFGFVNSPFAMEAMVARLTKGLKGVIAYVDDISIVTPDSTKEDENPRDTWQRDLDAHVSAVRAFLVRCRNHQVYLARSKVQLIAPVVDVLGSRIEVGRAIHMLPSRAAALAEAQPPHNLKTLERIVGAFTYLAPMVIYFADRVAPLRALLRKARALDRTAKRFGPRPSSVLFP